MKAIYLMNSIDALGFSLVGIFIPIFIINQGYGLADVVYYFIVHNIFLIFAITTGIIIGKRTGLQFLLIARLPFLFLYFLALLSWNNNFSYLWIAILSGMQAAFYWLPLNIIFTRESKPKNMGKFISRLIAYPQVVAFLGPLTGAFIIKISGFRTLFLLAFIVIAASVLPILKTSIKKVKYNLDFKKGIKLFKKYKKYMIAEIFDNIGGESEGIIWPVFIFLTSMSVVSVGFIGALMPVGSILFTLLLGKLADKGGYRFYMKIGAISLLTIWLLRFVFTNPIVYYISTALSGFCILFLVVPFNAQMAIFAKREVVDEFIVFREYFFFIGRMILFALVLVLLGNIKLLFPIAGLAYLYFLFL